MRRAANSERSTVVEESRKTPPQQVKGNGCSRSNIHTLLSLQYEGQLEDFGFLCSIAFMSIPLLAVFCDALAQICNVGKCVTDWFGAHLLGQ